MLFKRNRKNENRVEDIKKSHNKCPYCGYEFEVTPKRKKKCPNCKKFIFVRKGELVTEEEAYIRDTLFRLHIPRGEFEEARKELSKRFGQVAIVNDAIWMILNNRVGTDYHETKIAYYQMADIVSSEGKDPKPYIRLALETELLHLKEFGVKEVEIVGCGGRNDDPSTCEKCRSILGKRLTIEQALKYMPIPKVCERVEGCRCDYKPVNLMECMLEKSREKHKR
jgi:hypothetical protein